VANAPTSGAQSEKKASGFELIGGHPALDLVNTLDWRFREGEPEELLTDYSDLLRFVEQSDLVPSSVAGRLRRNVPEDKAEMVLLAVHNVREAAANILYAAVAGETPEASLLRQLEDYFKDATEHQQWVWAGSKLVRQLPQSPALPDLPLWLLTLSTAEFMTSDRMHQLRECGNPECRWLFVDTSKNHTRRWCDMKVCGNRMKARRFKAHRAG
jgi:predicted RNA-binding Zn ribbon-like protein